MESTFMLECENIVRLLPVAPLTGKRCFAKGSASRPDGPFAGVLNRGGPVIRGTLAPAALVWTGGRVVKGSRL